VTLSVMLVLSFSARRHHRGTGATARPAAPRWCGGRTGSRVEIPDFTMRRDEIGDLSGALRGMTDALYSRNSRRSRAFAADVAHELKNPLTSMRSAVETLPLAKTDASRARLLEVIEHDVKRLEPPDLRYFGCEPARRGIAAAQDRRRPTCPSLLTTVVTIANEVRNGDGVTVSLKFEGSQRTLVTPGNDSRPRPSGR